MAILNASAWFPYVQVHSKMRAVDSRNGEETSLQCCSVQGWVHAETRVKVSHKKCGPYTDMEIKAANLVFRSELTLGARLASCA